MTPTQQPKIFLRGLVSLLFISLADLAIANPTGGTVVAGSASIGAAGPSLNINQSTQNAIINWQQFSIANGESTKFIVPNSSAATLNRVVGGNPSLIYGTLQSNGVLYLVNPSGIVVGPSGRIDTASFLASTLDVSNEQFLKGGNLNFAGSSKASIDNEGTIQASGGDVYLVSSQVINNGTVSAPQGNVGLAAGSDVLFQPAGKQHLFVNATSNGTTRALGVSNSGTIRAAAAELRAAGGNAYALAINNTGSIAATGYKKINGQVYLTSDGGSITSSGKISARTSTGDGGKIVLNSRGSSTAGTLLNSGQLDASSTVTGGIGGAVTLKNSGGATVDTGSITAKGGVGGHGGDVEISGKTVQFTGTVDTTAAGGVTGTLLIDPLTFTVAPSGGDETGAAVSNALNSSNVQLNADNTVTIDDAITWTSGNTLTLSTNNAGSTINIDGAISGVNGGLSIETAGASDVVSATSSVQVATFILQNGSWSQNNANVLPAFSASHNFALENGSTFLRALGGNGTTNSPYKITDIYGLEGLASPSKNLLTASANLVTDIDASGTVTWNNGAGFVPIGSYDFSDSSDANTYQGTFNGQGHSINGLSISLPNATSGTGLFGDTASASTLENLSLSNANINGNEYVGILAGVCNSTVLNVTSSGTVAGEDYVGGLVGISSGAISDSYSVAAVVGKASSYSIGGLDGYAQFGSITDCYSTGAVTGSGDVGGLLGSNGGTITASFWDTSTSGQSLGVGSGSSAGAVGDATSALLSSATYSNAGWNIGTSLSANTWVIFDGQTRPLLATEYSTTITNSHELQLMGLNATTLAANYIVAQNVDLSGITNPSEIWGTSTGSGGGFVPIGNSGTYFSGTFNGQQHTINRLYIDLPNSSFVGLFGVASNVLENVSLTNVQITGDSAVGGLVGAMGNANAGTQGTGSISGISVTGTIVGGGNYVGGLAGFDHGTAVDLSYTAGSVSGSGFVGGLEGSTLSQVSNSYSTASVNGGDVVGGLIGENYYGGTLHNTYSSGSVTGTSETGGLVGRELGSVNNSFWDTTTSGITTSAAGIGSTTSQLETQSYILANSPVSPTWDFTSIWTTNGDTTLPQLIALPSGSSGSGGSSGGSGGTGGSSGGSGSAGGSSSLTGAPSTGTGGADDAGSNLVPPALTAQPTPPSQFPEGAISATSQPQPTFAFSGIGSSGAEGDSGLASSSGNSGQVGSGDAAQLSGGQLNNVANPLASSVLDLALGPVVYQGLAAALKDLGD
jgi:filamentous hemagglutinin family protein